MKNYPERRLFLIFFITLALTQQPMFAITWLGLEPSQSQGAAASGIYGMNLNLAMDPHEVNNPEYQANLSYMAPSYVRYHAAEQISDDHTKSWLNTSQQTWDKSVIQTCLGALNYQVTHKLITITRWPSWMDQDQDGRLDENSFDAYANFCAELVDIVNKQQGHNVVYWEPFNEVEGRYPHDVETLADIYNRCAAKMKAKDASIKMVGGAWTQPWAPSYPGTFKTFLKLTKNNIDVCSYHQYGSGDGLLPIQNLYDKVDSLINGMEAVKTMLSENGMSHRPIWLTEHNMFWSWDADSQGHMVSDVSAVWDALLMSRLLKQGIADAAFSWLEAHTRYGKISYNWSTWTYDVLNPAAHVYHLFNRFGEGQVVHSTGSSQVQTVALKNSQRNMITLVLINRSDEHQSIYLGDSSAYNWHHQYEVKADGLQQSSLSDLKWKSLPPHSVTFAIGGLGQEPPIMSQENFRLEAEDFDAHSSSFKKGTDSAIIGYKSPNAWGEYHGYDFPAQARYDLKLKVGSYWGGLDIQVKVNQTTVATFKDIPQTWNDSNYSDMIIENVLIPEGQNQSIRIQAENGSMRIDHIDFLSR